MSEAISGFLVQYSFFSYPVCSIAITANIFYIYPFSYFLTYKINFMAWMTVDKYYLGFNVANRQFMFYYHLTGEANTYSFNVSPAEMTAISDMFRNEGPMFYNTTGNYFVTNPELVGEGEN